MNLVHTCITYAEFSLIDSEKDREIRVYKLEITSGKLFPSDLYIRVEK